MMSTEADIEQQLFGSIRSHLWVVGILACVLVGGVGVWVASTQISGAVVAMGTVVVESNTKQVQHQEGGIVKEIKVKDGGLVRAGDLLIRLDDTVVRASWEAAAEQLDELYAQKARLLAEQAGAGEIVFFRRGANNPPTPSIKAAKDNQQRLFQARRSSLAGQKSQLQEQIAQLRQKIAGLKAESDAKKTEINFVNRELADVKPLFEKQFIASTRITELERDKARLQGAYSALVSEMAQDRKAISEHHLQILQLEEDARVEILQQLQETRVNIARLEKEKIAAEDQLQRLAICAPRSGYVHNLSVHTVGGVIAPGETVMLLVPERDLLLVEAQVRPVDIEQLALGQDARVRLPSFDQRTTPELNAQLKTLSADLLQDQVSGEMYYQARLSIAESELSKLNGKPLIPGMPVEVFARTGERTVLSYLLKPVSDQIAHALRER